MRRGERIAEHVEIAPVAADDAAHDDVGVVAGAPFVIDDAMSRCADRPRKLDVRGARRQHRAVIGARSLVFKVRSRISSIRPSRPRR